jgi:hypothetical protein
VAFRLRWIREVRTSEACPGGAFAPTTVGDFHPISRIQTNTLEAQQAFDPQGAAQIVSASDTRTLDHEVHVNRYIESLSPTVVASRKRLALPAEVI